MNGSSQHVEPAEGAGGHEDRSPGPGHANKSPVRLEGSACLLHTLGGRRIIWSLAIAAVLSLYLSGRTMWCTLLFGAHRKHRSNRTCKTLLLSAGIVGLTLVTASQGIAQQESRAEDSLVESQAAVEGQPDRISDWALAGVVWSDAHLVRKLAEREATQATDPYYAETMEALVADTDQIIDVLKEFGWRHLRARQAELAAEAESPPAAVAEREVVVPSRTTARARRTSDLDLDLRRYRVIDDPVETPAERRSLADAVEEGTEEALAAGADSSVRDFSRRGTIEGGESRAARRNLATQSDTLPYSRGTIYDVQADYDSTEESTTERRANPLVERAEGEVPDERIVRNPNSAPSDDPEDDDDSEDVDQDRFALSTPGEGSESASEVRAAVDVTRFTGRREQFAQDAAWVQFQFDANQRTWQMVQAHPTEISPRRYLDAAVAQLQAHAQVGERITDDDRLADIFRAIGGAE